MKQTDNPEHKTIIEFCLLGRVVKAEVFERYSLCLTYEDGKYLVLAPDNYGDSLSVTMEPAPAFGDMLMGVDPGDEDGDR